MRRRLTRRASKRSYFFFFLVFAAFFLGAFLAAAFFFLATVRPPKKVSGKIRLGDIQVTSAPSESHPEQTKSPTELHNLLQNNKLFCAEQA